MALIISANTATANVCQQDRHCFKLPPPAEYVPTYNKLTVKQAILIALENNQNVESDQMSVSVAKLAVDNAYYNFAPQLSADASAAFTKGSTPTYNAYSQVTLNTPIGTSLSFEYTPKFLAPYQGNVASTGTVVLAQPLLQGFGLAFNEIGLTDAYATYQVGALTFKSNMMTLVQSTIANYYSYLISLYNLEQNRESLEAAKLAADNAKMQVKVGQLAQSQLSNAEASLAQQQLSFKEQENALVQNRQIFLTTLGIPFNSNITLDQTLPTSYPSIKSYKPYYLRALQNNINILTQKAQMVNVKNNVISAKNARKWTLTLSATFNVIGQSSAITANNTPANATAAVSNPGVNLALIIPIRAVDTKATLISDEISLAQQQINLAVTENTLRQTIKNAVISLNLARDRILVRQQQIVLTRDSVRNAEIKLAYGQAAALEMSEYRQNLTNSQIALGQTEVNYINTKVGLLILSGDLLKEYGIALKY